MKQDGLETPLTSRPAVCASSKRNLKILSLRYPQFRNLSMQIGPLKIQKLGRLSDISSGLPEDGNNVFSFGLLFECLKARRTCRWDFASRRALFRRVIDHLYRQIPHLNSISRKDGESLNQVS